MEIVRHLEPSSLLAFSPYTEYGCGARRCGRLDLTDAFHDLHSLVRRTGWRANLTVRRG